MNPKQHVFDALLTLIRNMAHHSVIMTASEIARSMFGMEAIFFCICRNRACGLKEESCWIEVSISGKETIRAASEIRPLTLVVKSRKPIGDGE